MYIAYMYIHVYIYIYASIHLHLSGRGAGVCRGGADASNGNTHTVSLKDIHNILDCIYSLELVYILYTFYIYILD